MATHQLNDCYVSQLPSPPRLNFASASPWTEWPNSKVHPSTTLPFIQGVNWEDHFAFHKFPDWQYEYRRKAQSILPFLYLGPWIVCKDVEFLRTAGIDLILVVRHTRSSDSKPFTQSLKRTQEAGISLVPLDVQSSQELIAAFPKAIATINKHLTLKAAASQPSSVLVCCESGNSRSAAIAIAYCMEVLGINLQLATQLVHARRFCTSLDDSLKLVLSSYDEILQAKRDVFNHTQTSRPVVSLVPPNQLNKRGRDDADEDMEDVDDIERFENRSFSPFRG